MTRVALCLVILCLLATPVVAANITITAGQQEYYFLTGQPVVLPLTTTSSYSQEINGTLLFSTDEQLQKTGTILVKTENRVTEQVIPPGTAFLNLSMAGSNVSRGFKVHISYYYRDPASIHISLPEIIVRIVTTPGQVQNIPSSLTSISGPGGSGAPEFSSVSIREQAVSVRQQIGADTGSRTSQGGRGGMNASSTQDQQDRMLSAFGDSLNRDPLFSRFNESLGAQGFALRSLDARPATNDTGTFTAVYGKGTDQQVVLGGSMDAGIVPEINGRSNIAINTTPELDSSPNLALYKEELVTKEFQLTETTLEATPFRTSVNMSFANSGGKRAFINGTDNSGNVTVTMAIEGDTSPFPLMAAVGIVVLAVSCLILARYSARRKTGARATVHETENTGPVDTPAAVLRLLASAQEAYAGNRYPEAYGFASRALRLLVSSRYGAGSEITATEAISLIQEVSPGDLSLVEEILSRCMDVEFARDEPVEGEFTRFVGLIHGMIEKN